MARRSLALLVVLLSPALILACRATVSGAATASAARVHAIGGGVDADSEASWALGLTYEQELTDLLAFEVGYFNEGHPDPEPHRDGFAVQLFAGVRPFAYVTGDAASWLANRLRLRAGVGPSVDFNTVDATRQMSREVTRAGFLFTGALDLRIAGGLAIGPRVVEHVGIDSHDALVFALDVSWILPPATATDRPGFGVNAATGESKRNAQGGSGTPVWVGVERNSLFGSDRFGASAAYLDINGPNDRRGVAVGVNAEERFGEGGALGLGAGVGPYFYDDGKETGQDPSGVTALIRTSVSYRLWRNWRLVAMFLREAGSSDQQNYDVFLGGVGYEFDLPPRREDEAAEP